MKDSTRAGFGTPGKGRRFRFTIRGLMIVIASSALVFAILREWAGWSLLVAPLGLVFAPFWVPVALLTYPKRKAMALAIAVNALNAIAAVIFIDLNDQWGGVFGIAISVLGWFGFVAMMCLRTRAIDLLGDQDDCGVRFVEMADREEGGIRFFDAHDEARVRQVFEPREGVRE